jgi:hypothetical protein
MKRVILSLIAGLLVGVVGTVYFFGRPGRSSLQGALLRPPDANAVSGSVTVTLEEKFFDALLGTIFQQLGPPQLKLGQIPAEPAIQPIAFQEACNNVVVLNAEGGGVKTGVRFTGGKIVAPLAFTGSYNVLGRCIQFKGTGKASVALSFEQTKQTVFGELLVEEVNLESVPPLVSAFVTAFVRQTIAAQVNPFEVLRASQLALSLPIKTTGGSVKANVKDVRSEVQEGSLRIVMTYDFSAEKGIGS